MPIRIGATAAAAVCLLSALFPNVVRAQNFSPGTDAGGAITLDLGRGRFINPLPFDVQFFVVSPVGDDVTKVVGRWAFRTSTFPDCNLAIKEEGKRFGEATFFKDAEVRKFELSVPALKPRKAYCFGFTVTRKLTELVELRTVIAKTLDTELQGLYKAEAQETMLRDQYEAFRQQLIQHIKDAWKRRAAELNKPDLANPEFPDESFFGPGPISGLLTPSSQPAAGAAPRAAAGSTTAKPIEPSQRLHRLINEQFRSTVNAQLNKPATVKSFQDEAEDFRKKLTELHGNTTFQTAVQQLRASSAKLVATRIASVDPALTFSGTDAGQLGLLAIGRHTPEAVSLDNTWVASELGDRFPVVNSLVAQMEGISVLFRQLGDPDAKTLREAAGLSAATPKDLQSLSVTATEARVEGEEAVAELVALQNLLVLRSDRIRAMTSDVTAIVVAEVLASGTTVADWETRAMSYLSADVGLAGAPAIDSMFFYLGVNFYFGPVNKRAPLAWRDGDNFRKRFALMVGIPLNPFTTNQNDNAATNSQLDSDFTTRASVQGVIGSRPLLVGAGFRLNDLLRLTGGAVLLKTKDPDPLKGSRSIRATWFASISVDWDVKGAFVSLTGKTPTPPPAPPAPGGGLP